MLRAVYPVSYLQEAHVEEELQQSEVGYPKVWLHFVWYGTLLYVLPADDAGDEEGVGRYSDHLISNQTQ